mgnify:CR=1 FL=1
MLTFLTLSGRDRYINELVSWEGVVGTRFLVAGSKIVLLYATRATRFQVKMKLQLVSEGKCFAFLAEDLHSNMQLAEVREKLKAETEQLMPSSYQFLYRNIPLSEKQESLLTLSLCWEQLDAAKEINVLQFSETNTTPELWGAVCKKNYLEQICDIFTYWEIIKTARKCIYK